VFVIAGVGPDSIYPVASGSGTFAILLLMLITSAAVLVYFVRRRRVEPESIWKTLIAPAVSCLFLGVITYLAIANYSELIAGSTLLTVVFMTFTFALFLFGIVYALILRRRRPDVYARLGRQKV
jgi:RsiW-degrading membrane proteinase PrsW (M82 family)